MLCWDVYMYFVIKICCLTEHDSCKATRPNPKDRTLPKAAHLLPCRRLWLRRRLGLVVAVVGSHFLFIFVRSQRTHSRLVVDVLADQVVFNSVYRVSLPTVHYRKNTFCRQEFYIGLWVYMTL